MSRTGVRTLFAIALLCACALFGARPGFAAALTVATDRTSVTVGETFTLILSLTGGDSTQPPDLSGIAKDFDIVDRRRTSRNATVDGKRSTVNEWILTLSPKRAGALTIPALSIVGLTSAPVRIAVAPAAPTASSGQAEDRPIFIQVEVGDVSPYVQSEIPVFVRIYDSVGMRSGSISRLTAEGATFTPQGDQESYLKTIGKTRYRVIEQGYLMLPQKSGTIQIQSVTLQANVPGYNGPAPSEMARLLGRGNVPMPWLDGSMSGRDVTLRSDPVKVEVKPRPADAKGWFLPARRVMLTDAWSPALSQAKAGDTLTRTIKLEAVGASPNQLPPITAPEAEGVRQYDEDSRSENVLINGEAGAILTKTISVVLTRAGDVTLPAIDIPWWNTTTNTQEHAVLPAVTFKVQPGAATATATPQPVPVAAAAAPASTEAATAVAPSPWLAWWDWLRQEVFALGAALVLVLVLGAALLWWRSRRAASQAQPRATQSVRPQGARAVSGGSLRSTERDLKSACRNNDPAAAHRAYLAWSRLDGAKGHARLHPEAGPRTPQMQNAVKELRGHLYGAAPHAWNGAAFLTAFKAEQRAGQNGRRAPAGARLAPLYPEAG
ncbi:BatD family protein [Aquabacter sp. CN5-332]|uniref:BatD family protein n=1 Tax=Aquabacter sp. CN5-332 TaxID=3156608 RepID=UPI0032B41529